MLTFISRIDGIFLAALLLALNPDLSLDITIELKGVRPNAELQLKVSADIEGQKFKIEKSKEKTIRRASKDNRKM